MEKKRKEERNEKNKWFDLCLLFIKFKLKLKCE